MKEISGRTFTIEYNLNHKRSCAEFSFDLFDIILCLFLHPILFVGPSRSPGYLERFYKNSADVKEREVLRQI